MEIFLLVEATGLLEKYSVVAKADRCDICEYRPGQTKSSGQETINVVDII